MRGLTLLLHLLFVILTGCALTGLTELSDQYLVFVMGGKADALRVANKYGFRLIFEIPPNRYVFQRNTQNSNYRSNNRTRTLSSVARDSRVVFFQQQEYNIRVLRSTSSTFNDTKWKDMWYFNLNTTDVIPDQGVLKAWSKGFTGKGIVIGIVDNGVETNHPDLEANQISELGYNFMDGSTDPSPDTNSNHGTKTAGIAAAVGNNGICIIGSAYEGKFVALKMMDRFGSTSTSEAGALSYKMNDIDIYTNSWGVIDRVGFHGPNNVVLQALENGIKHGRNGKGSIYVWAAGNGGSDDNCNCDGYVNSIYTIAISGVGYDLYSAHYAEQCSVIIACTYGSDDLEYFVETTDIHGQCGRFTGTSATAPMAAGILAMALQANNNLTWRDIQHIVVKTSKPDNLKGGTWNTNAVGKQYHDYFGFGLLDADALIDEATGWKGLPKFRKCLSIVKTTNKIVNHLNSAEDLILSDGCNSTEEHYVEYIEHVQVKVQFSANQHKDVLLSIISPANTESKLLSARPYDTGSGQQSWIFTTVHFWGETAIGKWKIRMSIPVNNNQGNLNSWQLHIYGTSVHPSSGPDNDTDPFVKRVERNKESGLSTTDIALIASGVSCFSLCIAACFIFIIVFKKKGKKNRASIAEVSPNFNNT